jgi:hypothetical protein
MNTFIILTAAILVIALVWFFTKESKTTDESYPLTQEDKEWLEAPLETPPTPEPVVEPVAEVVVESSALEIAKIREVTFEVKNLVETLAESTEVKPVITPKKKSNKRPPAKKKPGAAK